MKIFTIILVLIAVLFVESRTLADDARQASSNSLDLVLKCDEISFDRIHNSVEFNTATNISFEVSFRNFGEINLNALDLVYGLSVVWDGKEYMRDPKRGEDPFLGDKALKPYSTSKEVRSRRYLLSRYLIPESKLTSGWHKFAVRSATAESNIRTISAESNTLNVFIKTQK